MVGGVLGSAKSGQKEVPGRPNQVLSSLPPLFHRRIQIPESQLEKGNPFSFPSPSLLLSLPSPFLPPLAPLNTTKCLGGQQAPWWGLEQSPIGNRIWCMALKSDINLVATISTP